MDPTEPYQRRRHGFDRVPHLPRLGLFVQHDDAVVPCPKQPWLSVRHRIRDRGRLRSDVLETVTDGGEVDVLLLVGPGEETVCVTDVGMEGLAAGGGMGFDELEEGIEVGRAGGVFDVYEGDGNGFGAGGKGRWVVAEGVIEAFDFRSGDSAAAGSGDEVDSSEELAEDDAAQTGDDGVGEGAGCSAAFVEEVDSCERAGESSGGGGSCVCDGAGGK